MRQDDASWQLGYADAAGPAGGPCRVPARCDKLAYYSGYIEGKSRRAATGKVPLRGDPQPKKRLAGPDPVLTKQADGALIVVIQSATDEETAVAEREHAKAMEAWDARRGVALADCNYKSVAAQWDAAMDELSRVVDAVANFRATTWSGLKCKARIRHYDEGIGSDITHSIADDLLTMPD